MAPRKTKKAAKTKRTPSQVKRNTRSHQTRTSPQESPSQNIYIKQEESDETLLTTPGHTTHAHLTPTHKSSSTTYKIKKSTSYPKTPLNAVQSIAMTRCRNSIRRAEFREYVRLGITPLEGKGSGIVQGGQGMTNPLVDEGGEEEIPIIQENSRNELEN
ncbi:hypothetical protein COCSADRAFT_163504 [Bipolaris sorokiniana ND90Pr]|nr:uncharacterized protein COCSADRAFT_163504 [Bipolaris sorokiniana ND90Pr]EMD61124.1 hypothetical protein COCSADRAFT_163504 [Bipolaris sorokiniana ND90Pr]